MINGLNSHVAQTYGKESEGGEEAAPSAIDLMSYLPSYYQQVLEMDFIQGGLGERIVELSAAHEDVLKQYFVQTSTWGLARWEKILGLSSDSSLSYAHRRESVIAKLRGAGTTTRTKIIQTATAFSGGEVNVVEYPEESRFEVLFVGTKGIPPNMAGFIQMLDDIKPAHLSYSLKYTYTVWNQIKELTWQQAKSRTWSELRVYEGV
ncbi:putative phage tail protein [Paenibacillus sinopodophylli]|uniref:putative phage tail protein n=1 Tax=Paenibacillus sinopodophylli TaxID=1837342 RepID=UPI001FE5E340|nr:putative phage tail protein [Paenibacillus sinopodophylli]